MANLDEKKTKQESQEPQRKKGLSGRLLKLLALLLVVLAVVVLTTMEDGSSFAALRRWLMYGDSGSSGNRYTYTADSGNRYGQLGGSLLLVSGNSIQLLRDDGTALYDLQVSLKSPSLSVGDNAAAVCDVGGGTVYLLDTSGVYRELTASGSLCYYSARLNGKNYLAVTEQKTGYKASVTVYNDEGEKLFGFDSHDSYISDALVTEDCRYVVAVSLDPRGGVFGSTLLVYDLSQAQQAGEYPIRDGLVMELVNTGDRLISLCDTRLSIISLAGETLLDYSYGNLYLHDYALTGGDFCALLLGRYQAGNVCQLSTFDLDGEPIASLEVTEEVLDLSAAGEYLAVLYSDSLVIYTRDLQEYARLEGTDYAGRTIMGEDGTALVLSGSSAWRYLP